MTVRADGYTGPASPGVNARAEVMTSPVVVDASRAIPELNIGLVKEGTITGRIRDSAGNPLSKVTVSAFQLKYDSRGRVTYAPSVSKITDDIGEYRLAGVPAGEYWIGALPPAGESLRTFFPGSTDPGASSKLTVSDGNEIVGI